ncbi:sensory neuron membrane protein 1-like [Contarinia nasturtii]|uniref:sensory neuron membrane protein 1-like n=1 Tax=Contarinia nasturtii TaxID=265458 RepID=UPI0012D4B403|nr:sensory neuron membrane protein 1-like [Contarinia nasturtii]
MQLPAFLQRWNAIKCGIISICIFLTGLGFFGMIAPMLFKKMVKGQLNLLPKSQLRPLYVKVPFFLDFRIYVFNLTNPDEVTKGGKPKVQEVGPYFFEEWKEKFDLVDNDEEDTLKYHYKNTFIFRPDLSGDGLTGNEIITMPHPLITTMFMTLNVDKKPMIPMTATAIDAIFHNPKDMFWTGRVMDVLFDGIPIDCSTADETMAAKAVCGVFSSGAVAAVQPHNDTFFKFSLFQAGNATDLGEFTVFRGKKNSPDIGKVVAFNDEPEMDYWEGDECNQYTGTDSTIFPPYMDVNDGIIAYEPSICRSLIGTTGTPMNAAKRLQFNLEMVPIEDVPYLADIQEMYYPLFWIEEGAALGKEYVNQVKNTVLLAIKIQKMLKWLGIICGILGIILSGIIFSAKMGKEQAAKTNLPSPVNNIDVKAIEKSLT